MATGANTTPLGRLNPILTNAKSSSATSSGNSMLKPSYMNTSVSIKREHEDDSYGDYMGFKHQQQAVMPAPPHMNTQWKDMMQESTNWPPDIPERKKKRRSRWGGDDKDKVFIPGMPTVLPNNLRPDQERAYLLQLQIEEISRRLRTGDLGIPPNPEDRSPSPEPIYNSEGKRLNTREYRTRKKLEDDRHSHIQEMLRINTDYKPPADYKPPIVRVSEKVMIPQEEHPDINFVGLLIGPRGNTLKAMEKETGAKIIIRGKGSVKEGKVARKDGQPLPGEDEPLHAFVTANNSESVKKAVEKIREIIRQGVEVPEGQNDLRRMQLRELALLNGTLRENDGPRCTNCGATTHRSWQCPDKPNVTNNVICTNCGGVGHIARDCRERKTAQGTIGTVMGDKSKIDEEYMSLMAELGEGPPPPVKTTNATNALAGGHGPQLGAVSAPPRAIMAPPMQQPQVTLTAPPPWVGAPQAKPPPPPTLLNTAAPPPPPVQTTGQPPNLLPPPPPPPGSLGTAAQPQQGMPPWQPPPQLHTVPVTLSISGTTAQPSPLGIAAVPPPPPTLLAQPPPPPPPPSSQPQQTVSGTLPWLPPQHTSLAQGTPNIAAAVTATHWNQPQQSGVAQTVPVPPPHPVAASAAAAYPWATGFMAMPPMVASVPPPGQPPIPPGLVPPPPPPPAVTAPQQPAGSAASGQGVDLSALAQAGLPSLLTAPPPPPPT